MPGSPPGRCEEGQFSDEDVSDLPLPAWMEGDSLAPPCQADMDVVRAIIDFAEVTSDDVLYDLGCGDGRICIEAAESRGAKACGVEIEEHLAQKFQRRVDERGLDSMVSVVHGDLRDVDLSDATVVVMYLLPEAIADISQSHLLPLLRRGRCDTSDEASRAGTTKTCVDSVGGPCRESDRDEDKSGASRAGNVETLHAGVSGEGSQRAGEDGREGGRLVGKGGGGGGRGNTGKVDRKKCRIVCNTWGIPGATAVREAGVGAYGGVKLRLFTCESLNG